MPCLRQEPKERRQDPRQRLMQPAARRLEPKDRRLDDDPIGDQGCNNTLILQKSISNESSILSHHSTSSPTHPAIPSNSNHSPIPVNSTHSPIPVSSTHSIPAASIHSNSDLPGETPRSFQKRKRRLSLESC